MKLPGLGGGEVILAYFHRSSVSEKEKRAKALLKHSRLVLKSVYMYKTAAAVRFFWGLSELSQIHSPLLEYLEFSSVCNE